MEDFLAVIILLTLLGLILGLVKPDIVIRWGKNKGRKEVLKYYGILFVFCFFLFGMVVDSEEDKLAENEIAKVEESINNEKETDEVVMVEEDIEDKKITDEKEERDEGGGFLDGIFGGVRDHFSESNARTGVKRMVESKYEEYANIDPDRVDIRRRDVELKEQKDNYYLFQLKVTVENVFGVKDPPKDYLAIVHIDEDYVRWTKEAIGLIEGTYEEVKNTTLADRSHETDVFTDEDLDDEDLVEAMEKTSELDMFKSMNFWPRDD